MSSPHQKGMLWALVALGALAAGAAGLLIHLLWAHLGLPDAPPPGFMADYAKPYGMAKFMYLGFPLAAWLPTAVLAVLLSMSPAPPEELNRKRVLQLEALSYLALPLAVLLPLLWVQLGNVWLAMGLVFMGLVSFKAWLLAKVTWQGHLSPRIRSGSPPPWRALLAVFLGAATIFLLTAGFVQQAVSSVGAEVNQLLLANYLAQGIEPPPPEAVERTDYQSFHWEPWNPISRYDGQPEHLRFFPPLVSGAYLVAGRAGVLGLMALLSALLAMQLLVWLETCGVRPAPAALAAGLCVLSAPVFFHAQQALPIIPGALLLVLGLRLLWFGVRRPWLSGLGVAAVTVCMYLLQVGLAPLGVGLLLIWLYQAIEYYAHRRSALAAMAVLAAAAAAAVILAPDGWWPQALRDQLASDCGGAPTPWLSTALITLRGLALDQSFGVIFAAPVFLLALAGLPTALRRHTRAALHVLIPLLCLLVAIHHTQWCQWFGGFAAPGKLVAVALPACALFMAPCLAALAGPWQRLAILLPAGLGLAYVWLLTLMPPLRFSNAVGINRLVETVQPLIKLPFYHLLPSNQIYSPWRGPWLLALGLLTLGLAVFTWLSKPRKAPEASRRISANELLAGFLITAVLVAGFGAAALRMPPKVLEAELMASSAAPVWAQTDQGEQARGRALQDGHSILGWMHFPGGQTSIRMDGFSRMEGVVRLALDGVDKAGLAYSGDRGLVIDLGKVTPGGHAVKLSWQSCPEPDCFLVVDRLVLQ